MIKKIWGLYGHVINDYTINIIHTCNELTPKVRTSRDNILGVIQADLETSYMLIINTNINLRINRFCSRWDTFKYKFTMINFYCWVTTK